MATVSTPFAFRPTRRTLDAALAALDDLAEAGGGAIDAARRDAALAAYPKRAAATRVRLRGWRHDYGKLSFQDLEWTTGRLRVPALPAAPAVPRARRDDEEEPPALAVANAGGIVHLGSIYLQPQATLGDPRVVLANLADARLRDAAGVDAVLGRLVPLDADPFVALGTAFQNCGAYVEVPAGVTVAAPVQLVWSARPGGTSAVCSKTVVRLGRGARATIVERHLGTGDGFTTGTVEIELAEDAELDYVAIQQVDDGGRVAIRRAARLEARARIGWHVADLGGALARTVLATSLAGSGSRAATNAIGFARGFTNIDQAFATAHAAPARSSGVARTVLLDKTRARFHHALASTPAAEDGAAAFHAETLVLGKAAAVSARPSFAIATPGLALVQSASVGSLDREQLFYVQSRGIPLRAAERMIALAFFEPAIVRLPSDELRDEIRTALDLKLDEIPDTFE